MRTPGVYAYFLMRSHQQMAALNTYIIYVCRHSSHIYCGMITVIIKHNAKPCHIYVYLCTSSGFKEDCMRKTDVTPWPRFRVRSVCGMCVWESLQWRHNWRDDVPNHRGLDCLLSRLFRRRTKKTSKLRVTGLCEGNPAVIGGFPSQRASYAENVSIWWRHRGVFSAGDSFTNRDEFNQGSV